jgi:hypothetical protein
MYTVVSWYTPLYEAANKRLRRSLDALGIPHVEYSMRGRGNWYENISLKPLILRQAFADVKGDIVYTDSDSVFLRRPVLFDEWYQPYTFIPDNIAHDTERARQYAPLGHDLGVHYRAGLELLGGTQYWRKCDLIDELIDAMEQGMQLAHQSSQVTLNRILPQWVAERGLRVRRLPAEYCCIFDNAEQRAECGGNPVVEHYQHSRQLRNQEG